ECAPPEVLVLEYDWGKPLPELLVNGPPWDVALASDVLFDPADWEDLWQSICFLAKDRMGKAYSSSDHSTNPLSGTEETVSCQKSSLDNTTGSHHSNDSPGFLLNRQQQMQGASDATAACSEE
ncbi:unnamed protein product, partial [Heterosigma akashiwo]